MKMRIGRHGFVVVGLAVLPGCSAGDAERVPAAAVPDSAIDSTAPSPPEWLGQAVVYTRRPGDTLRYRDVVFASLRVIGPDGDRVVNLDHEAALGVRFVTPDSAQAWYHDYALTVLAPGGRRTPASDSLIAGSFALRFGPRGRVETLAAPAVVVDSTQVLEPGLVFAGFFPPLPADPLQIGLEWTDSLSTTVPVPPEGTLRLESVGRYRAVGSAVVDGESVLDIDYERDLKLTREGAGAVKTGRLMEGREEGSFLFVPARGLLLNREFSGRLHTAAADTTGRIASPRREFYEYRGTTTLVEDM